MPFSWSPCTEVLISQRLVRTGLGFEEYRAGLERNKRVIGAAGNMRPTQLTAGAQQRGMRYSARFIETYQTESASQHDEGLVA